MLWEHTGLELFVNGLGLLLKSQQETSLSALLTCNYWRNKGVFEFMLKVPAFCIMKTYPFFIVAWSQDLLFQVHVYEEELYFHFVSGPVFCVRQLEQT